MVKKPRLPPHFRSRLEASVQKSKLALHLTSGTRDIVLEGPETDLLYRLVIPLLDGKHAIEDICAKTSEALSEASVKRFIAFLSEHNAIQDAGDDSLPQEVCACFLPQLGFLHEVKLRPHVVQANLAQSTVGVAGMGGIGAWAALHLVSAGVGTVRCIDPLRIVQSDSYLFPSYISQQIGALRVNAFADSLSAVNKHSKIVPIASGIDTLDAAKEAIEGCDFVICCAEIGLPSLLTVNEVCIRMAVKWTSCAVAATEGVLGPTIFPSTSACYECYANRALASVGTSTDSYQRAFSWQPERLPPDSTMESTAFAATTMGSLACLEAFKILTGLQPSALGKIVVFDFLTLTLTKHVVLRKPWCPACFGDRKPTGIQL